MCIQDDVSYLQPQIDCGGLISRKWVAVVICAFGSALLLFSSLAMGKQASPLLDLKVDNALATAGFYRLSWQWGSEETMQDVEFELQESATADFSQPGIQYRGPDLATVISGKSDGLRYYRVRAVDASVPVSWSQVVEVTTAHHTLARALTFFALGAVVFALTLAVILRGVPPEHTP